MLKNVLVFESIVKITSSGLKDPLWLWALSQTSAILPIPAVLLQNVLILSPKKTLILISKILVDFSAFSLCDSAPALQLVWRRHWHHQYTKVI